MKRRHSWDDEPLNESEDDFDWDSLDISYNDEPCDKKVSIFLKRLVLSKKESYIFCYINGLDFESLYFNDDGTPIERDEDDSDDEPDEGLRKLTGLELLAEKLELSEEQTINEISFLKSRMSCEYDNLE